MLVISAAILVAILDSEKAKRATFSHPVEFLSRDHIPRSRDQKKYCNHPLQGPHAYPLHYDHENP